MTIQRFGVVLAAGVFAWGLAAVGPVSVAAQAQGPRKLDVSFDKGLVTIEAQNVTVREILLEWGRKGGSRIVNAEKLAGRCSRSWSSGQNPKSWCCAACCATSPVMAPPRG